MPAPTALATWREKLAYYLEQEAIVVDPAQKFALQKAIEEARAKIAALERAQTSTASRTISPIDVARLPSGAQHFVGRTAELAQLDAAWADPATRLFSLVAFGGVGKSTLVAEWLRRLADDGWRGAVRVFGYSFFSQGAREEAQGSADPFFDAALRFFGDPNPTAVSGWEKGERLAHFVQQQPTLLILDGLEPLQWGPNHAEPGRLKDPGLQALVRELSYHNPGLCLITTRLAVADVPNAPVRNLEQLSPQAGAALLRALGVHGSDDELHDAARAAQGHGLTLTLLGTYLRKAFGGDVRHIGEVALAQADARQGGRAFKIIERYERWLGEGVELSILRLLGLFDRPAEADCIAALRKPPAIPGLTDALVDLPTAEWNYALATLREAGLLIQSSVVGRQSSVTSDQSSVASLQSSVSSLALDAHPLIREYFAEQLAAQQPDAYRAAHRRLYEHLAAAAPERPDTLEAMMPLYHAVVHGCKAGEEEKVYNDIYFERIKRRNQYFTIKQFGAFGSDLGAIAAFFDGSWRHPSSSLSTARQAVLLGQAAFYLRALSRLAEAVEPMQAALDSEIQERDWESAAINAANLSELTLTLGKVAMAYHTAVQSVELADRSGDTFQRMARRTKVATALYYAGQSAKSHTAFKAAEIIQAERQHGYALLHSLPGFQYSMLLLAKAEAICDRKSASSKQIALSLAMCHRVRKRVEKIMGWRKLPQWDSNYNSALGIALDHLALGRTYLLEAQLTSASLADADLQKADLELRQSVSLLRRAGTEHHLPRGLLALAELGRTQAVVAEKSEREALLTQAERALDEVEQIAERGNMVPFQIDAAVERARVALVREDRAAAAAQLAQAQALVKTTEAPYVPYQPQWAEWEPPAYCTALAPGQVVGYHRRNREIGALSRRLAE